MKLPHTETNKKKECLLLPMNYDAEYSSWAGADIKVDPMPTQSRPSVQCTLVGSSINNPSNHSKA